MNRTLHRAKQFFSSLTVLATIIMPFASYVPAAHADVAATIPFSDSFGTTSGAVVSGWDELDPASIAGSFTILPFYPDKGQSAGNAKFAKIGRDGWIQRTIDATGYGALQLSYVYKTDSNAEGSDHGVVEYCSGASCTSGYSTVADFTLDTTGLLIPAAWSSVRTVDLSALENTVFSIRFRASVSALDEFFRVDDVSVTGQPLPVLTVTKTVVNDNGGTAQVADFPLFVGTTGVTSGIANAFSSGSYVVSETGLPGYASSTWGGDCAADGSISLGYGEIKACTLTNDDIGPTLTLFKEVVGSTSLPGDFQLTVSADASPSPSPMPQGSPVVFSVGDYTVGEVPAANFTPSYSGACSESGSVTLALGENKSCTVTNTYVPPMGTLHVQKSMDGDIPGDVSVGEFSFSLDSEVQSFATEGTDIELSPGVHSIFELDNPDYIFTAGYSSDCFEGTVTIVANQTSTCTITNTFSLPPPTTGTLVVQKIIDGGNASFGGFSFQVNGGDPVTFGASGSVSMGSLEPGSYEVAEIASGDYRPTYGDGCPEGVATVAAGETTTCVITNTFSPPARINIVKHTTGTNGEFRFTLSGPDDPEYTTIETDGLVGSSSFEVFPDSDGTTYSVTEDESSGWELTDVNCVYENESAGLTVERGEAVTLDPGDEVTCTFSNSFVGIPEGAARITINKETEGGDGTFHFDGLGEGGVELSTEEGSASAFRYVYPDYEGGSEYTLQEDSVSGWKLDNVFCENVAPQPTTPVYRLERLEPSPSVSADPEPSPTASASVSPTPTETVSPEVSPSVSVSPEATPTESVSPTPVLETLSVIEDGFSYERRGVTFTANPGDDIVCTFSNVKRTSTHGSGGGTGLAKSTLTVEKVLLNNGQSDATFTDFRFSVGGASYQFEGDGSNEITLEHGTYTVAENPAEGYFVSYGGDCDENGNVTLLPGRAYSCRVTNTFSVGGFNPQEEAPVPTPSPRPAGGAVGDGESGNPTVGVSPSVQPSPVPSVSATPSTSPNNQTAAIGGNFGSGFCSDAWHTGWWVSMLGLAAALLVLGRSRGAYLWMIIIYALLWLVWAWQICSFGFAWLPVLLGMIVWLLSVPRPGVPMPK